jgi:hypothetical protein
LIDIGLIAHAAIMPPSTVRMLPVVQRDSSQRGLTSSIFVPSFFYLRFI